MRNKSSKKSVGNFKGFELTAKQKEALGGLSSDVATKGTSTKTAGYGIINTLN